MELVNRKGSFMSLCWDRKRESMRGGGLEG